MTIKPFDPSKELIFDTTAKSNFKGANPFYQFILEEFPDEVLKMQIYGRRNISWSTVAPTGSVSLMTQTTSGIEPLFAPYYKRRVKDDINFDYTDIDGQKFKTYFVLHQKFKEYLRVQNLYKENLTEEELKIFFDRSPYKHLVADNIPYLSRLSWQSTVQKYTTHSISSTINLPENTSKETINNIFLKAYEFGLKGVTIYREGSRAGILVKEDKKFPTINAPKRPKELHAEFHLTSIGGITYGVIIGIYENKPFEIFSIKTPVIKEKFIVGKVIKVKKGTYDFNYGNGNVLSDIGNVENLEERAATLAFSGMLRHYAPLEYVIKSIKKFNPSISSFTSGISRILAKYIKDLTYSGHICTQCKNKLVYEGGCKICKLCGYTSCD